MKELDAEGASGFPFVRIDDHVEWSAIGPIVYAELLGI